MPRYYFHVQDGVSTVDNGGTVLRNLATAKREAVKVAGRMRSEEASAFWETQDWRMTVTDQSGLTLFSLIFMAIESASISAKVPS